MSLIKQEMSTLLNLTIRFNLRTITEVTKLIDGYFTGRQNESELYQDYLKLTSYHKFMLSSVLLSKLPKYYYEEVVIHDVNEYWVIN